MDGLGLHVEIEFVIDSESKPLEAELRLSLARHRHDWINAKRVKLSSEKFAEEKMLNPVYSFHHLLTDVPTHSLVHLPSLPHSLTQSLIRSPALSLK